MHPSPCSSLGILYSQEVIGGKSSQIKSCSMYTGYSNGHCIFEKRDREKIICHQDKLFIFFLSLSLSLSLTHSFLDWLFHFISVDAIGSQAPVATNKNNETYMGPTIQFTVYKQNGTMFQTQGDHYLMHDRHHFTQGLTYSRSSNVLYQSNGLFGKSTVCKLHANTGETLECISMDKRFFAEGMQVYGKPGRKRLIQITWKSRIGFIYNADTLEMMSNFTFTTTKNEGWGICYDDVNHEFIVSDGSHYLHFWDADSLAEKRRVAVTRQNGEKAYKMNELEFVNGKVLANVWYEDVILVIDPVSGDCQSEYGES